MKKTSIFLWFISIFAILSIVGFVCNYFSDGVKTIQKEYKPSALLKKYEYFKDLSAAIDKKRADIEMYQNAIQEEKESFEKNQLKAELRGIISMHNQLCSDYNSAMSKFNYNFTNKGDLPETNLEPLPREYKPYINNLKNVK